MLRKLTNKKQMIITWYGHACFKIQTKPQRGSQFDEVVIFTDPFDKSIGLRPPQGNADIVTISHTHYDHNNTQSLKGNPLVIDAPGEYSIKNIPIEGIDSFHDNQNGALRGRNTIFVLESEDIRVCHLGDLGHILNEKQLEKIGEVDVLLVPVGGKYTLGAKEAEEVVAQIEPKIIVPMHYKTAGLNLDIDDEKEFCSRMGAKSNGREAKLVLKKKDLEEVENKLVLLEIANS